MLREDEEAYLHNLPAAAQSRLANELPALALLGPMLRAHMCREVLRCGRPRGSWAADYGFNEGRGDNLHARAATHAEKGEQEEGARAATAGARALAGRPLLPSCASPASALRAFLTNRQWVLMQRLTSADSPQPSSPSASSPVGEDEALLHNMTRVVLGLPPISDAAATLHHHHHHNNTINNKRDNSNTYNTRAAAPPPLPAITLSWPSFVAHTRRCIARLLAVLIAPSQSGRDGEGGTGSVPSFIDDFDPTTRARLAHAYAANKTPCADALLKALLSPLLALLARSSTVGAGPAARQVAVPPTPQQTAEGMLMVRISAALLVAFGGLREEVGDGADDDGADSAALLLHSFSPPFIGLLPRDGAASGDDNDDDDDSADGAVVGSHDDGAGDGVSKRPHAILEAVSKRVILSSAAAAASQTAMPSVATMPGTSSSAAPSSSTVLPPTAAAMAFANVEIGKGFDSSSSSDDSDSSSSSSSSSSASSSDDEDDDSFLGSSTDSDSDFGDNARREGAAPNPPIDDDDGAGAAAARLLTSPAQLVALLVEWVGRILRAERATLGVDTTVRLCISGTMASLPSELTATFQGVLDAVTCVWEEDAAKEKERSHRPATGLTGTFHDEDDDDEDAAAAAVAAALAAKKPKAPPVLAAFSRQCKEEVAKANAAMVTYEERFVGEVKARRAANAARSAAAAAAAVVPAPVAAALPPPCLTTSPLPHPPSAAVAISNAPAEEIRRAVPTVAAAVVGAKRERADDDEEDDLILVPRATRPLPSSSGGSSGAVGAPTALPPQPLVAVAVPVEQPSEQGAPRRVLRLGKVALAPSSSSASLPAAEVPSSASPLSPTLPASHVVSMAMSVGPSAAPGVVARVEGGSSSSAVVPPLPQEAAVATALPVGAPSVAPSSPAAAVALCDVPVTAPVPPVGPPAAVEEPPRRRVLKLGSRVAGPATTTTPTAADAAAATSSAALLPQSPPPPLLTPVAPAATPPPPPPPHNTCTIVDVDDDGDGLLLPRVAASAKVCIAEVDGARGHTHVAGLPTPPALPARVKVLVRAPIVGVPSSKGAADSIHAVVVPTPAASVLTASVTPPAPAVTHVHTVKSEPRNVSPSLPPPEEGHASAMVPSHASGATPAVDAQQQAQARLSGSIASVPPPPSSCSPPSASSPPSSSMGAGGGAARPKPSPQQVEAGRLAAIEAMHATVVLGHGGDEAAAVQGVASGPAVLWHIHHGMKDVRRAAAAAACGGAGDDEATASPVDPCSSSSPTVAPAAPAVGEDGGAGGAPAQHTVVGGGIGMLKPAVFKAVGLVFNIKRHSARK